MKKIIKIGVMAVAAVLMCGCGEDFFDVDPPTLEIEFANPEQVDLDGVYHAYVGEQIIVNITGDMDILYQYSGEAGSQYVSEAEYVTTGGTANLCISTKLGSTYGTTQKQCLRLRISNDFTGIEDSMNINNATWITIPYDDVGFDQEGTEYVYSDTLNLFDYMEKPYEQEYVYIAYQYKSTLPGKYSYTINERTGEYEYYGTTYSPTWNVQHFNFNRVYEDGRVQYYGLYDPNDSDNDATTKFVYAGFVNGIDWVCEGSAIDDYISDAGVESTQNYWVTSLTTGTFTPTTDETRNASNLCNDDWLISRKFNLSEPPVDDPSLALKGISTDVPETTTFYYANPGVYELSIVAKNLTIKTEEIVVKRLTVNVTDPDAVVPNY